MPSSAHVFVAERPIDLATLLSELAHASHGAQLLFTGTVRNLNHGREVVAVTYDVLSPLAERTIGEICAEAESGARVPLSIVVAHRRGRVEVGQSSIAIGVGAPHRDEAYRASRHLIEEIKKRAPIWKHEHYADGESRWLEGH